MTLESGDVYVNEQPKVPCTSQIKPLTPQFYGNIINLGDLGRDQQAEKI